MSNSIYNILNNFNKVAQEPVAPATTKTETKTKLHESMEQVISEKYMGFKKTVAAVKKSGSAENPEAVAAAIGRKKYGKEKFQKAAAQGKKLGEEANMDVDEQLNPSLSTPTLDKIVANKAAAVKRGDASAQADYDKAFSGAYSRDEQGQKKYSNRTAPGVINKIKDTFGLDKPDPAYGPKPAAPAQSTNEADMEEGNEFTGALAKAKASGAKDFKVDGKTFKVDEVAPPGAKAERMVKHVKKGYAKDGKLTPKEKSIAYATAWKAHKAGKVEEAVNALKTLSDAGMTRDQIVEGWEDMMKATKARAADQGTGKFDKKKTSTGTVYTRKYNPKSGETDDTENVSVEKRGRGRPKKSAFESYVNDYSKSLTEGTVYTAKMGQPPQDIDGASVSSKSATPAAKPPTTTKNMGSAAKALMAPNRVDPKAKVIPSDPEGVKEGHDELAEMMKLAGMSEAKKSKPDFLDVDSDGDKKEPMKKALNDKEKVDECSMMSGDAMGHDAGKMNITTSMDSDGAKNVTISANGDAAADLLQMLKLAGVSTSQDSPSVEQSVDEAPDDQMEEEKDSRYEASTTPDEEVKPVQALTKGGNGEVAGQEKKMTPNGYKFSDNPMAMKEGIEDLSNMGLDLIKAYESIKLVK